MGDVNKMMLRDTFFKTLTYLAEFPTVTYPLEVFFKFTVYALLLVSFSLGATPVADIQLQTDNCRSTIADQF